MAPYICSYLIALIAFFVGLAIIWHGIHLKMSCTESVEATVVDIKRKISSNSRSSFSYHYYPVFQYQVNGENIIVQHNISPTDYNIGDTVSIMFNERNPSQYYIPNGTGSNHLQIFVGSFFSMLGFLFLFVLTKVWLIPLLQSIFSSL